MAKKQEKSPSIGSRLWLDTVDEDEQDSAVQNLLHAAHGVCLVLNSLSDDPHTENLEGILSGLASVLRCSADQVYLRYFRSAGDLAGTLDPRVLTALLKGELGKVEHRRKFKRGVAK